MMGKGTYQDWAAWLGQFLALVASYVLLEWISSLHEFKGLPFIAWDPGLGVLFAALILRPYVGAPALFAGILCAEALFLLTASDLLRVIAFALIITLSYLLSARLIQIIDDNFDVKLSHMRDVVILLGCSIIGALASATLLIGFVLLRGELTTADIAAAGWPHVVGDVIGIAVVTPLCLKLFANPGRFTLHRALRAWPEAGAFLLALALFVGLVSRTGESAALQYFYILFIPTVLAAARFGLLGACLMLSATELALVIILELVDADPSRFTAYQTLMLVLSMTGLLVGTLISERDAARLKAAALEEEATRAARFNLVSGMASALLHDLSQPLTAARARARTMQLLSEANDVPRLKENLTPLLAQIDRASTILHGMRDFMGRSSKTRQACDFASMVEVVKMLTGPAAEERGVKLIFTADAVPPIPCDRTQIEQVLINLISNALDAHGESAQDKWIRISASRGDGHHVEISVTDNGPGIDPQIAPRLFEALVTTKSDGLGLGIVICKSIIESHAGRLWLQESRPGHTEFRISLPIRMGANS